MGVPLSLIPPPLLMFTDSSVVGWGIYLQELMKSEMLKTGIGPSHKYARGEDSTFGFYTLQ